MGNHYKSGSNTKSSEIRPSSISGLRVCRNEVPDSHWHCQSSRRESSKFLSFYFGFYRFNSLPPENFVHVGITQCFSRFSSVGSPSYETSSVSSSGQLETSPRQFGPTYSNIPFMSCSNQMVDESFHLCGWNSPCYTSPRFPSVSDDSHSGWGAHLEPLGLEVQGLWDVASQDLHINNLELRAVFLALQHFQSHLQFLRDGSVRQFISSGLPQEARGDPLSISVHASMGASLLCHHRNIHIQVRHIPGKLNVLADSLSRPDEFSPPNGL